MFKFILKKIRSKLDHKRSTHNQWNPIHLADT